MSGQLRLSPIRASVARDRRRARAEVLAPAAQLARRRGCGSCEWSGVLLVVDGAVVCPSCGSIEGEA